MQGKCFGDSAFSDSSIRAAGGGVMRRKSGMRIHNSAGRGGAEVADGTAKRTWWWKERNEYDNVTGLDQSRFHAHRHSAVGPSRCWTLTEGMNRGKIGQFLLWTQLWITEDLLPPHVFYLPRTFRLKVEPDLSRQRNHIPRIIIFPVVALLSYQCIHLAAPHPRYRHNSSVNFRLSVDLLVQFGVLFLQLQPKNSIRVLAGYTKSESSSQPCILVGGRNQGHGSAMLGLMRNIINPQLSLKAAREGSYCTPRESFTSESQSWRPSRAFWTEQRKEKKKHAASHERPSPESNGGLLLTLLIDKDVRTVRGKHREPGNNCTEHQEFFGEDGEKDPQREHDPDPN
ncbi:hypothetical protein DFH06DRAFT_1418901 [Mycena polygramma]|nr:hypothetical protein DFH06DRAFT_1418901 [Mycena polygramma]